MELQNVEDIYPLSPTQHGMLFHTLYEQGTGAYVQQVVYTLAGPLNATALHHAWEQTLERHPILRTAFVWQDLDAPLQVVRQQVALPWDSLDWSVDPASQQAAALAALCATQRERGLALDESPLMNCTLIRLSATRHWFIWNHHHIILDAWSIALVMGDVFSLYDSFNRGSPLLLATPPLYRDYIAWLQAQDLADAAAFWRETLRGFSAATPLPAARGKASTETPVNGSPASGPPALGTCSLGLAPELTARLRTFVQRHHLTLNTLVQGAWALLLSHHGAVDDVVFGATTSGRPPTIPGIEAMVGLFINTLPVRVSTAAAEPLVTWLQGLQKQQAQRDQYAASPLVEIQGWSGVPRGSALFESLLVFENAPANTAAQIAQSGLEICNVEYSGRTNYPLAIGVVPGDELFFEIQYDTDRFTAAAISRVLGHLESILTAMAANPHQRPAAISWLPQAEYEQIVVGFNPPAQPPGRHTWPELFALQVAAAPDHPALVAGADTLTYAQLDRRANALAWQLQSLGVGPESFVGLYLDRSADLIVALLAVLKSGGVAVPLDPTAPGERLRHILEQLATPLVLTRRDLAGALPAGAAQAVALDDLDCTAIDAPVRSSAGRTNLAYAIFTSGSTGLPKGVLVPHGALADHCVATGAHYAYTPADRVLQFAVLHFDAALEQILPPLLCGATVVLRGNELWDAATCAAAIDDFDLSVVNLPTAYWHQLITEWAATKRGPRTQRLRLMIVGGEAMAQAQVALWGELFGARVRLLNAYGPTEAVITAAVGEIELGADSAADLMLPIGQPFGGRSAYILDRAGLPVPAGGIGELYLGGAILARGYLNQPALSAERFVPDPFSQRPGTRLYRTGDLARYRPDGQLIFVGRSDHQIKLRGFRIELSEIELALARHQQVQASVVVVHADSAEERRLIAYVVPGPDTREAGLKLQVDLRDFLSSHLPGYMLPAAYVFLEALPLTSSGKLDRLALPDPRLAREAGPADFVAPRTFVEQELASMWIDLLHVDAVGVYDNFFALGGHSLLIMQLVSRIRETFEVTVPLRALFDAPTVVDMSKLVAQHLIAEADPQSIDEMLDELQNLTPDELSALLQVEGE